MRIILLDEYNKLFTPLTALPARVLQLWGVPRVLRPFVTADLKISVDATDTEEWLAVQENARAILITDPNNQDHRPLPRCVRATTLKQALTLAKRLYAQLPSHH